MSVTRIALLCGILWSAACSDFSSGSDEQAGSEDAPATLESTDQFQATRGDFGPRAEMPGAALYSEHCVHCHDGTVPKAPHFSWLEMMTPAVMLKSLNEGVMSAQAASLSAMQRRHIVEYVTRSPADLDVSAGLPMCADGVAFDHTATPPRVGWGHDTTRFTPKAAGGVGIDDAPHLELKWSFVYPGALRARSQPAIGWGAIYTGSQDGTVYAFDLEAGCVLWTFTAAAEVRTGIVLTEGERPLAIFGDILAKLYAVDAFTGEQVWVLKADDHPSATLTGHRRWSRAVCLCRYPL